MIDRAEIALGNKADTPASEVYLPDFCAASTIFVIVLIAALVAILLSLAAYSAPGTFLTELSTMSMFVMWLALPGAALLCRARPWLERFPANRAFVYAFLLLLAFCLLMAELTWQVTNHYGAVVIIEDSHGMFVLRTFAISSIVVALLMRYLYVASEWRRSIVLEAQARISALQALIRPHFLFNSMNTIASLTRTDPQRAEEAVEDLADLLRANLSNSEERTTLKAELEVAAIYQRIEKLRLGDRLNVRWDVDDLPMRALIPSLTIQPLLENAIYHGIELLPDGGEVQVTGKRDGDRLHIEMSNPVANGTSAKKDGNKMAMANIQQRYDLAYSGRATVGVENGNGRFTVSLEFPYEEATA